MKPICLTNDTVPTGENTQRKGVKGRKDMERHGKMTKGAEAAETSSSNLWDPLRSSPSRHLHRSTALVPREGPQPKPRHDDGRGCVSSIVLQWMNRVVVLQRRSYDLLQSCQGHETRNVTLVTLKHQNSLGPIRMNAQQAHLLPGLGMVKWNAKRMSCSTCARYVLQNKPL